MRKTTENKINRHLAIKTIEQCQETNRIDVYYGKGKKQHVRINYHRSSSRSHYWFWLENVDHFIKVRALANHVEDTCVSAFITRANEMQKVLLFVMVVKKEHETIPNVMNGLEHGIENCMQREKHRFSFKVAEEDFSHLMFNGEAWRKSLEGWRKWNECSIVKLPNWIQCRQWILKIGSLSGNNPGIKYLNNSLSAWVNRK